MSSDNFLITSVSPHVMRPGTTETYEDVVNRHWILVRFLQENGLVNRQLASGPSDIGMSFELNSEDVTSEGLRVLRVGFYKWLRDIDRGKSPSDIAALTKALHAARA